MVFELEIKNLAKIEILEAYDWYESKKANLGEEFLIELSNVYDLLRSNPFTYSFLNEPIRQGAVNRFPYVVVYEIINSKVVVYSVFMTKQRPQKKRIR